MSAPQDDFTVIQPQVGNKRANVAAGAAAGVGAGAGVVGGNKRPKGHFKPKPELVGFLLGSKGQALRNLAKEIDDGVYIIFNDQTRNFDICARSIEGVRQARLRLELRQFEAEKINKDKAKEAAEAAAEAAAAAPVPVPVPAQAQELVPPVPMPPLVSVVAQPVAAAAATMAGSAFPMAGAFSAAGAWAQPPRVLTAAQFPSVFTIGADGCPIYKLKETTVAVPPGYLLRKVSVELDVIPSNGFQPVPMLGVNSGAEAIGKPHPALGTPKKPVLGGFDAKHVEPKTAIEPKMSLDEVDQLIRNSGSSVGGSWGDRVEAEDADFLNEKVDDGDSSYESDSEEAAQIV